MLETITALLLDPAAWVAFLTLTTMEVVLGIDNLILLSILADKLPKEKQHLARRIGLIAAVVSRLLLLGLVFMLAKLQTVLFTAFGQEFTISSVLLILGGMFLIGKATTEIHHKIEGVEETGASPKFASFWAVITQIAIMDIVFSFDSVMTAIGIAKDINIMIAAILVSLVFMIVAVDYVSGFINRHPTIKILALSYMILIGMALVGEGLHFEIPKGYLYFAMAFSFLVEAVNMIIRRRTTARASGAVK